jgi:stearoyl-CoA desaturase (delta-9 desaturase)
MDGSSPAKHLRALDPSGLGMFVAVHVGAVVGIFFTGISWFAIEIMLASYVVRMWAITAGYHRYFSHRSFKTSRVFAFIMGAIGTVGLQRGPLWWAAQHRKHHRFSDTKDDHHSIHQHGLWWAYGGWAFGVQNLADDYELVRDFARYPELRWLNKYHFFFPALVAALVWIVFGTTAFVWGVLVTTVLQWNAIFAGNIYCHLFGRRRFETKEFSTNSLIFGLLLLGEGWHNNHHYSPRTARQGFTWWEVDFTYYVLKLLEQLGLVWDLHPIPRRAMSGSRSAPRPDSLEGQGSRN